MSSRVGKALHEEVPLTTMNPSQLVPEPSLAAHMKPSRGEQDLFPRVLHIMTQARPASVANVKQRSPWPRGERGSL